jgi:hypothetical protein
MAKPDFELLTSEITRALDDPDTQPGRIRDLLAHCSSAILEIAAEKRKMSDEAHGQIMEIAGMIDRQNVTWPEDVARHAALSNEVRQRAELFRKD